MRGAAAAQDALCAMIRAGAADAYAGTRWCEIMARQSKHGAARETCSGAHRCQPRRDTQTHTRACVCFELIGTPMQPRAGLNASASDLRSDVHLRDVPAAVRSLSLSHRHLTLPRTSAPFAA